MATPEIEPGWLSAAWAWIAGIGATVWGGWKFIDTKFVDLHERVDQKAYKSDVREALDRIDKSNTHIERLYENAEKDREKFSHAILGIKDDVHGKFDSLKTIIMNERR